MYKCLYLKGPDKSYNEYANVTQERSLAGNEHGTIAVEPSQIHESSISVMV